MRLLLVEDEPRLAEQLTATLTRHAYAVDHSADGESADFLGSTEPYAAAILDLGLPGIDGLTVLRRWRRNGAEFPVVVLTARGDWSEKVEAIDAGADDYVVKPFHIEELLARVRAVIRRSRGHARAELRCGDLVLDTRRGTLTRGGEAVELTANELKIVTLLMHARGELVTRTDLAEQVYALGSDRDSNTIEVFIGRLRRKIGSERIQHVRGGGYRMECES